MYQLDKKILADAIQHAYNDTGVINDFLVQEYLSLLIKGSLKDILPIKINALSVDSNEKPFHLYDYYSKTSGYFKSCSDSGVSTTDDSINFINERDRKQFDKQSYKFLYTLRHTLFEDGMDNEATYMFNKMTTRNKYVAIAWLYDLWADNQSEPVVVEGILRLMGRINDRAYWKSLMAIVRAGLTDKDESVSEAAIMVIESWRTIACYQALKQTQFSEGWIKDYAIDVLQELEEELKDEIYKED